MVKTKEELLEQVKTIIGDDTSDVTLEFLSDVSDTIDDFQSKLAKSEEEGKEDWKKKFEENDAAWRQKYKERFFSNVDDSTVPKEETEDFIEPPKEKELKTNFDELFN